ncbi:uncharacterized protein LOC108741174 [Agrilus planipennis]|uniref:Uncharacterized protein LOC108741174 n=1 Tax=Agrilus planipennis TaxID=224129 RepID=A0A1W4XFY5_AGRPL|nr:uncharacterized protein LOC108741174 [Agrilus planipennis]
MENASENKETLQNYKTESDLLGEIERKKQNTIAISRTLTDTGYYAPKRFTTTCYFAPKKNPVKFSETCIITLGSKKKQYYETVQYETKLLPQHWSEKMSVFLKEPSYTSEKVVPISDPEYHYISLEPQQIAAKMNNHVLSASP